MDLDQVRIRINNNLLYKSRFNTALYNCVNIVLFSNDGEVIGSKEAFNQSTCISDYEWFDQVENSHGKSIWLPLGYDLNRKTTGSSAAGIRKRSGRHLSTRLKRTDILLWTGPIT